MAEDSENVIELNDTTQLGKHLGSVLDEKEERSEIHSDAKREIMSLFEKVPSLSFLFQRNERQLVGQRWSTRNSKK